MFPLLVAQSSAEEAEFKEGEALPMFLSEVSEVVKKLISSNGPGVDEMIKAVDVGWLSWPFQCHVHVGHSVCRMCWFPFLKRRSRVCALNYLGITLLSLPGKVYAGDGNEVQNECQTADSGGAMWIPLCSWNSGPLFTLAEILGVAWEFAYLVYMCFVDKGKAYGCIPQCSGYCGSMGCSGTSKWRSWKTLAPRGMHGLRCLACCLHDPAPGEQQKLNGWTDFDFGVFWIFLCVYAYLCQGVLSS